MPASCCCGFFVHLEEKPPLVLLWCYSCDIPLLFSCYASFILALFWRYSGVIPALFLRYSCVIPALFLCYSCVIPALFLRYPAAILALFFGYSHGTTPLWLRVPSWGGCHGHGAPTGTRGARVAGMHGRRVSRVAG